MSSRCAYLALVIVLGIGPGAAWAQTADELRAIYFRGDLSRMEEIARTGDMRAEAWMGLMLQNRGRRLEAKEWFRRAAEKGNRWAINSLARMHLADREDEDAARWFRRGAEAGDLVAQENYALLLLQGRGVIKDEQAAARLYSAAAAKGDKYSYIPLAELYASGTGVARDPVEAYALAAIAEVVLDDSDLSGMRLAELKAGLGKELSAAQTKAASLRAQAMRPDLEQLRTAKERAKRLAPIALLTFVIFLIVTIGFLVWRAILWTEARLR